ncbi:MAG TPA: hypothetical protein VH208_13655, partial [Myxococcaceae bacterium]|nr:hypothetical protein [Myxococcaceae bacterium]
MGSPVNGTGLTYGARIDQRLANQTQRIDNGGANQLLQQDSLIANQEAGMIGTNGGLTAGDRQSLRGQLNANSAAIHAERHPGAQPPPSPAPPPPSG